LDPSCASGLAPLTVAVPAVEPALAEARKAAAALLAEAVRLELFDAREPDMAWKSFDQAVMLMP
jgi:hypothetical protein